MGGVDNIYHLKDDKYLRTVRELRARNFSKNLPFLLLSDKLPEGHVYREFSDGRIEVQLISSKEGAFEAEVLKVLTNADADNVRKEYGLL